MTLGHDDETLELRCRLDCTGTVGGDDDDGMALSELIELASECRQMIIIISLGIAFEPDSILFTGLDVNAGSSLRNFNIRSLIYRQKIALWRNGEKYSYAHRIDHSSLPVGKKRH